MQNAGQRIQRKRGRRNDSRLRGPRSRRQRQGSTGQLESYGETEPLARAHQAYPRPARRPSGLPSSQSQRIGATIREETEEPGLHCETHNDHGNARRLIALHGHDMRYYYGKKRWLIWDNKRWRIDETGRAYKFAKEAVLRFLKQAIEKEDKKAEEFARKSLDHKRISAMLASAECELPIKESYLDLDGYLLNCLNGTLNVRTGELGEHRREDYITKLIHVEYKPGAECPLFLQFLRRIMGDNPGASSSEGERAARLVAYLQKAFGYSLTGDVSEKVIFCFFGIGNNGKTTLLETIRFVLWEYSAQLQIDSLMSHRQRESNASLSDVADLRGARFVTTSEAEQGGRLAEGKLKYLSAGMGNVKTCRKYENPITFRATHKLFIDANHKPIIRGTDQAIWNRLKLTPFNVTIPPDEIDKALLDKLKAEAEGILAWMVEGCRRWLAEGLGDPPEVAEASAGWRSEMSPLTEFIEDRCELRPEAFCSVSALRTAYVKWAGDNGQKNAVWSNTYDEELLAKGCRKERPRIGGTQVRGWEGIELLPRQDAEGVTE